MAGLDTLTDAEAKEAAALSIPPLENGAHLSAGEFLRRYEAMPEIKKAELIDGIVYMASPVRHDQHGKQDALIQTWLGVYALATPGVEHSVNSTVRLGSDDVPQPDALLRVLAECGGQSHVVPRGYIHGAPELIVEIAASSVSIDLREKRDAYRRAGVKEYFVWRTQDGEIDWWMLEDDEFRPLPIETDGTIRSRTFPGLWAKVEEMLAGRGPEVLGALQLGLASPEHADFVKRLQEQRGS